MSDEKHQPGPDSRLAEAGPHTTLEGPEKHPPVPSGGAPRLGYALPPRADGMIYAPGEWLCNAHNVPHCKRCPEDEMTWAWRDWAGMVVADCATFPKGAHDDIPDSVSQALKHLREIGVAIRPGVASSTSPGRASRITTCAPGSSRSPS